MPMELRNRKLPLAAPGVPKSVRSRKTRESIVSTANQDDLFNTPGPRPRAVKSAMITEPEPSPFASVKSISASKRKSRTPEFSSSKTKPQSKMVDIDAEIQKEKSTVTEVGILNVNVEEDIRIEVDINDSGRILPESTLISWKIFSENPEKRFLEKWVLFYSLLWPILFGGWCISGKHLEAGDEGNLAFAIALTLPNLIIPAMFSPKIHPEQRIAERFYIKYFVWMAIFAFHASYFLSNYFFDVLGMVYNFNHLKWNWDSVLVGSGKQVVPLMMYFHTHYFFTTYHALSGLVIRGLTTLPLPFLDNLKAFSLIKFASAVLFAAWLFSYLEVYFTTMDEIKDVFYYENKVWVLNYGVWAYSCYFLPTFSMVYFMDEPYRWDIMKTIENACAACFINMTILDIYVQHFVPNWKTTT